MQNEWILDVLVDLRVFARSNGLGRLAEHLDDVALIAASDILAARGDALNEWATGEYRERPRASEHA
jgi:hypothetical protein